MRFLADESCDTRVVRALRAAGYDVEEIAVTAPGATDRAVLSQAVSERRVLLTEDKDFGELVFAAGASANGVVLIRYPVPARALLPQAIVELAQRPLAELSGSFVVLEPGSVRIARV